MNSFQKYLKNNIKKFDLLSFINYLKILDSYDFNNIIFMPNISLNSYSSIFEDIFFDDKITVLLNYPLPIEIKFFLNSIKDSDINLFNELLKVFSDFYKSAFLNLNNSKNDKNNYHQPANYNYEYIVFLFKNIFCEFEIDIKPTIYFHDKKNKNIIKIGDKLNINKRQLSCIIKIHSENNFSTNDFLNKYKNILDLLKKFVNFKIINVINFRSNENLISCPYKLKTKYFEIF